MWIAHQITVVFCVYVLSSIGATENVSVNSKLTCNGEFFTVLAEMEPWKTQGSEPCADTFARMDESIRILSAQMVVMNTSLTIYTTYKRSSKFCSFNYPNIILRQINATDLILSYNVINLKPMLNVLRNKWRLIEYARASDVLRLLLARKHQQSYIDPDIHLLENNADLYMEQYTGSCMWDNEDGCEMEVTNAAFCLSAPAVDDLISYMNTRILIGPDSYFYTELGPSMFHKVLFNRHQLILLSQNHPQHSTVQQIVQQVRQYGHKQLHLTSYIRGNLRRNVSLEILTRDIRRGLGLPAHTHPPPTSSLTPHSHSLSHSVAYTLTYTLIHPPTHSLTLSFTHPLTLSLSHSLTLSLTLSLSHPLTHSLTHSLTHLSIHSLTHPFAHPPTH